MFLGWGMGDVFILILVGIWLKLLIRCFIYRCKVVFVNLSRFKSGLESRFFSSMNVRIGECIRIEWSLK